MDKTTTTNICLLERVAIRTASLFVYSCIPNLETRFVWTSSRARDCGSGRVEGWVLKRVKSRLVQTTVVPRSI